MSLQAIYKFILQFNSCLPWLATDQGDEGKIMDTVRESDRRKLMKLTLLDAEKE